jgi:hypothetical protein
MLRQKLINFTFLAVISISIPYGKDVYSEENESIKEVVSRAIYKSSYSTHDIEKIILEIIMNPQVVSDATLVLEGEQGEVVKKKDPYFALNALSLLYKAVEESPESANRIELSKRKTVELFKPILATRGIELKYENLAEPMITPMPQKALVVYFDLSKIENLRGLRLYFKLSLLIKDKFKIIHIDLEKHNTYQKTYISLNLVWYNVDVFKSELIYGLYCQRFDDGK